MPGRDGRGGRGAVRGNMRVSDRHADAYVLSCEHHVFSTNASLEEVEVVNSGFSGDFLWGRRAGRQFVIRDARTIEEAQRLFDPVRQLDPEREALRRRQREKDWGQSCIGVL